MALVRTNLMQPIDYFVQNGSFVWSTSCTYYRIMACGGHEGLGIRNCICILPYKIESPSSSMLALFH